ncbi:MAG: hypothetical protein ACD_54C00202G0001, partial [uncultured bacterium]
MPNTSPGPIARNPQASITAQAVEINARARGL